MSDGILNALHLDVLWPILLPQMFTILQLWLNGRKTADERDKLKVQVEELQAALAANTALTKQVKVEAVRSKEEMETHAMGAGRQAVEEFKRASTLPAPLGFDPQRTDIVDISKP